MKQNGRLWFNNQVNVQFYSFRENVFEYFSIFTSLLQEIDNEKISKI